MCRKRVALPYHFTSLCNHNFIPWLRLRLTLFGLNQGLTGLVVGLHQYKYLVPTPVQVVYDMTDEPTRERPTSIILQDKQGIIVLCRRRQHNFSDQMFSGPKSYPLKRRGCACTPGFFMFPICFSRYLMRWCPCQSLWLSSTPSKLLMR